jgi:hypothetical protein
MLKLTIFVVFIALLGSLFGGFMFLVKDQGSSLRTLHSLGLRLFLALVLIALLVFGIRSGQLQSQAPWAQKAHQQTQ